MAKRTSKKTESRDTSFLDPLPRARRYGARRSFRSRCREWSRKIVSRLSSIKPRSSVKLHKSFRRSYREDYQRETPVPGMMQHIAATFKIIFENWQLFLPLLIVMVVAAWVLIGVMDENSYQEFQAVLEQTQEEAGVEELNAGTKAGLLLISTVVTGGLAGESSEATVVLVALMFLVLWLTTIFLLRHRMAGHEVRLRDGLYNAMTPLISTLVVLIVAAVQCVPLVILTVTYSAAVTTGFLSTPFYALMFWGFAALLTLLSGYLLSGTLMALVAVSAPGLYPLTALRTASDLMAGRRVKLCLRVVALGLALVVVWAAVMLPMILLDLWAKQFTWTQQIPFVPACLLIMTCFTGIYATTYLYLYYRWMIDKS